MNIDHDIRTKVVSSRPGNRIRNRKRCNNIAVGADRRAPAHDSINEPNLV